MRRTEIRDLRNPVGTPWVFSDVANKGLRTLIFSCGRDKDLPSVQGASDGIRPTVRRRPSSGRSGQWRQVRYKFIGEVDGAQKWVFDGGKELAGSNGVGDIAIHAGGETLFLIPFKVCAVIATLGVRMPLLSLMWRNSSRSFKPI